MSMTTSRATADCVQVLWMWTQSTPDTVPRARKALRCALDQLGCNDEVISDSLIVASELITNAVEHAPGPYELRLRRTESVLICEVVDGDPQIPDVVVHPAVDLFEPPPEARGGGSTALLKVLSEGGRGLQVVDQLTCGAWGFKARRCDGSKTAWAVIYGV
ncbi:ATP-binding protein [Actinomycetota bacterium Odt1-20B]